MQEDSVRQSKPPGFMVRLLEGFARLFAAERSGIVGEGKRSRWQRTVSNKHSSGGKHGTHPKDIAKRRARNKMAARSRRINRQRAA